VLANVMDAEDGRAALIGLDGSRDARRERPRRRLRVAEDSSEGTLAGEADQNRPAELHDHPEPPEKLEVLEDGLAEAEPGIEADPLLGDARIDGEAEAFLQEGGDLLGHVVVRRVELHRPRLALHVHQAKIGAGGSDHAGQLGVAAECGHVVHELGAELGRPAGNLGLGRVDRDRNLALERLEHGHDPPQLLVERHALGTGPRRLPTDVHDPRPLVHHAPRSRNGVTRVEVDTAVRERVGCDVDHAHDRRPRKPSLDWIHAVDATANDDFRASAESPREDTPTPRAKERQ
jgi:hypothetical protein